MGTVARDIWTDERLDDLNHRVDEGFSEMRAEFRSVRTEFGAVRTEIREESAAVRAEMRAEFRSVRTELGAMQRTMLQMFVGMMAGFAGVIATILATQL